MNKAELVADIADEAGVSKTDADAVVSAMFDIVAKKVRQNQKVQIPGWITFEQANTKARTGRNPQTGATIQIPAGTKVKITAGSKLKAAGKNA